MLIQMKEWWFEGIKFRRIYLSSFGENVRVLKYQFGNDKSIKTFCTFVLKTQMKIMQITYVNYLNVIFPLY